MQASKFWIDSSTCKQCGACAEVCPSSIIFRNDNGSHLFSDDAEQLCLACGQCMAVCSTKSIHAGNLDYEADFFEFTEGNDFFTLMEHRRSVRRFKPKPVEKEVIDRILYAVSLSPHGDKHHHVEITVVNSREKIMQALPLMVEFYDNLAHWLHNPLIRKMIQLEGGKDLINTLRNHLLPRIEKGLYRNFTFEYDGITRGAHTVLLFHAPKDAEEHKEDSPIMMTIAMMAAQQLGLGATVVGLIPPAINKTKKLRSMFNIPLSHEVVSALIIGYPKYRYLRGVKRSLSAVRWVS